MLLVHGMRAYTETGVIGRPSAVTADKGRVSLAFLAEAFGAHLDALMNGR
jgi:creatinine amidohydrolase